VMMVKVFCLKILFCAPISGNVRKSTWNARLAPRAESASRNAGNPDPCAGKPSECFPIHGTTNWRRENPATGPGNILGHAGERAQSLYEVSPIASFPANLPDAAGRAAHAIEPRSNRCSRFPRYASGPAGTLLMAALNGQCDDATRPA